MKNKDDAAVPSKDDENCVSGLISNVLTLIISILVWLQQLGCKNVAGAKDCAETCELNSALLQITQFAKQADALNASVSKCKPCDSDQRSRNDKIEKRTKSKENNSVYYAFDQNDKDQDCKKCCKKLVQPKDNENNNVIFEVVAAQMVGKQTQTTVKEFKDSFTEPNAENVAEKQVDATAECICLGTQISKTEMRDAQQQFKADTEDKAVQVDIVKSAEKIERETGNVSEVTDDEEDYEEEINDDDMENYSDTEEDSYCPRVCLHYAQPRPMPPYPQQMQYARKQYTTCQERPSVYPTYQPPVYKPHYNPMYGTPDPYTANRRYDTRPYYQKITRTIERGSPISQKGNQYQNVPPSMKGIPARFSRMTQDCRLDCTGIEKSSQSEAIRPPSTPPSPRPVSPKASPQTNCVPECPIYERDEKPVEKKIATPNKECLPQCPVNKPKAQQQSIKKVVVSESPPSTPPAQQADENKAPPKKCVSKCAKNPSQTKEDNNKPKQNAANPPQSKAVSLMPKSALAIDPKHMQSLDVEKAPDPIATYLTKPTNEKK